MLPLFRSTESFTLDASLLVVVAVPGARDGLGGQRMPDRDHLSLSA